MCVKLSQWNAMERNETNLKDKFELWNKTETRDKISYDYNHFSF